MLKVVILCVYILETIDEVYSQANPISIPSYQGNDTTDANTLILVISSLIYENNWSGNLIFCLWHNFSEKRFKNKICKLLDSISLTNYSEVSKVLHTSIQCVYHT